jgi:hypothetical protein
MSHSATDYLRALPAHWSRLQARARGLSTVAYVRACGVYWYVQYVCTPYMWLECLSRFGKRRAGAGPCCGPGEVAFCRSLLMHDASLRSGCGWTVDGGGCVGKDWDFAMGKM